MRDFDAANARDVEARIKGQPLLPQIDFAVGVKIHRRAGINEADVRQMSRDIARRQIKCTAQRDGRVREIAAAAVAPCDDLGRGQVGATGYLAVFDVVVNPVADGLHAREAGEICPN